MDERAPAGAKTDADYSIQPSATPCRRHATRCTPAATPPNASKRTFRLSPDPGNKLRHFLALGVTLGIDHEMRLNRNPPIGMKYRQQLAIGDMLRGDLLTLQRNPESLDSRFERHGRAIKTERISRGWRFDSPGGEGSPDTADEHRRR